MINRNDIAKLLREATCPNMSCDNDFEPGSSSLCGFCAARKDAIRSLESAEPESAEDKISNAGVFKGAHGLRGLAEADEFWDQQAYGTRPYYGPGGMDYLHRSVLQAAVRLLDASQPAKESARPVVWYKSTSWGHILTHDRQQAEQMIADGWELEPLYHAPQPAKESAESMPRMPEWYGMDQPWPLHTVLRELANAAGILLDRYDYDGHAHEEIRIAQSRAHEIVSQIFEATPQPAKESAEPIDMLLYCPKCNTQHIDAPAPEQGWDNPPHRSHECQRQNCRHVWRPCDQATNGVTELATQGKRDGSPQPAKAQVPEGYALVPRQMAFGLENMRSLVALIGETYSEDEFPECVLWVGETFTQEGPKTETDYGLNAVKCSERLPEQEDADGLGNVWIFNADHPQSVPTLCEFDGVKHMSWLTHWMPTGLRKPHPPQED